MATSLDFPAANVVVLLVLAAIASAALSRIRRQVRGTTLVAAWWWSVVATGALATVELALATIGTAAAWVAPLRFSVSVLGICPGIAVLGAKRPQDRAWSLIVLAMWVVLCLPAAELLLRRGQTLQIHGLRGVFLLILTAVAVLNWLPTRFWLAALIYALGQTLLLAPSLAWFAGMPHRGFWLTGFAAGVAGLVIIAWQLSCGTQRKTGWDAVWLDFRDQFGALWGLRVQQRFNEVASSGNWPLELTWWGFHREDRPNTPGDEPWLPALEQTLHNLFRRFVSVEWIASRLETGLH